MKLNHFEEASQYYEHVKSYLLQPEAHHNLIFGILDGLINQPERFKHSPYLVTVEEDNCLLAVALWTPPRKLVLSRALHPHALNVIAQVLQAIGKIRFRLPAQATAGQLLMAFGSILCILRPSIVIKVRTDLIAEMTSYQ